MYTLEAILARQSTLIGRLDDFHAATIVSLPQNIAMIPLGGALLQELEIRYQGGTKVTHPEFQQFSPSLYAEFERLIPGVDRFAAHLSRLGLVAYVEATFTGGYGGHATMVWNHGEKREKAGNDINAILQILGVVASPGLDEFETIGLGRHRSTKQWLESM